MQNGLKVIINKCKQFLPTKFSQYNQISPYVITASIALFVVIGSIKLFVELTEELQNDLLGHFDANITQYIISHRTTFLTEYFLFATNIGGGFGYLIVFIICSLIFILIFKRWKYIAQLVLVLFLALTSNLVLKQIIHRARPNLDQMVSVETLSYPSGHAMTAMAFYGFLIYLFYIFKINKFLKFCIITILSILILSIGISRIYLGVHFPSDIIGGFIAGFIWIVFCILLLNIIEIFKENSKNFR